MAFNAQTAQNLDVPWDEWVAARDGEARGVIVEGVLPARKLTVSPVTGRPATINAPSEDRGQAFDAFVESVAAALGRAPVPLRSAGAVAVLASPSEVRQLQHLATVKSVRPNRRLG